MSDNQVPSAAPTTTSSIADQAASAAEASYAASSAPAKATDSSAAEQAVIDEIIELDRYDKFKFRGQEMTPEELERGYMRQSDYTKKTQEIAREKQFRKALESDVEQVRRNPNLAEEFKKIYPPEFHFVVDVLLNQPRTKLVESETDISTIPPELQREFQEMREQLNQWKEETQKREVSVSQTYVDNLFDKYSKSYEFANEDQVINAGLRLMEENKQNPEFKMTDAAWERLFKRSHAEQEKRYQTIHKKKLEQQIKAGQKGADVGPGGAPVGRTAKKRSFAEATDDAVRELSARNR